MITDINSEDRLVQQTFADFLQDRLGWQSAYAWNQETFGPHGTLGRDSEQDVVLKQKLRTALARFNPTFPETAHDEAFRKLTQIDYSRSLLQHNQQFYEYLRDGVPVSWRDDSGETRNEWAIVVDFRNVDANDFTAVRELGGKTGPPISRSPDVHQRKAHLCIHMRVIRQLQLVLSFQVIAILESQSKKLKMKT